MKNTNKRNSNGVKWSTDQYRNIGGFYFQFWSAESLRFSEIKETAKKEGLKCRVIEGQLYLNGSILN